MPVLLLARGDKEGRDLLRKALEARYGLGAPAVETLKIRFDGRARTKLGPLTMWVPLEATLFFRFPECARWDFSVRAAGVPMRAGVSAFDGTHYRKQQKNGQLDEITQPEHVRAARVRLTVAAGMLLTPFAQEYFELRATGARSFEATNLETADSVHVTLHDDFTVDSVSASCLNPDEEFQEQLFTLQSTGGQQAVDDFIMPEKITVSWDNVPEFEVSPVAVESNPALDEAFFRLETASQA
jgi:hypothetical protein